MSLFSPAGKTPLGGGYLPRCGGFACLSARRSFPCGAVKFRRAARFRSLKDSGEFKRQALVAQFGFVVFRRLPLFCGAAVVFPLGKNSFACIIVFGRSPPFNAEFFYGFRRNAAVGRRQCPVQKRRRPDRALTPPPPASSAARRKAAQADKCGKYAKDKHKYISVRPPRKNAPAGANIHRR